MSPSGLNRMPDEELFAVIQYPILSQRRKAKLRMNPSLYDFKDGGTRCEIHTPEPPRHWYNYLWNENGYCAQISQSGYGRSYYINEKADMCRINRDGARYIYLRDDESQACWNIGKGRWVSLWRISGVSTNLPLQRFLQPVRISMVHGK